MKQKNLFGEVVPTTPFEILDYAPLKPCANDAVLLAFSGGNDSRALAIAVKDWFENKSYNLELAAIDTGLAMDGWRDSVQKFADWIGLPLSFWEGEGRKFYKYFVEKFGWPGPAQHFTIQVRLKGRAFKKMHFDRRSAMPAEMKLNNQAIWILSGVRKFESRKRQLLNSPYNEREGCLFISPLFYWTNAQVIDFLIENDAPLAPGKQWDCKCGATVKVPAAEEADIKNNAPELSQFFADIKIPPKCNWEWGRYKNSSSNPQLGAGLFPDDGRLESFPFCAGCWRDDAAEDERLMMEW
jgi:3'-phosphoadenosine 5'-phosphosulfate sulfotransferase (PAPS reductase)/FAD synthetase